MRYKQSLAAAFIVGVIRTAWSGPSNTLDTADLSIGEKAWLPVTNGLVFIDGKYISPPYVVSRREGEIFLNGLHLDWVMQWPPRKKREPVIPTEEPVVPTSITTTTTEYDKDYISYIYYMRQYLMAKFGKQKGVEMMVDVYQKLPCIRDAKIDPEKNDCIIVTWVTGEKNFISQVPPQRGQDNLTVSQAAQFVDRISEIYVRGLGDNNYFLVGAAGGQRGTKDAFGRTLAPLADAMRAAKDEAEFLSIMKTNQPVGGMSEAAFRAFYKHKDELPKWEHRIRKEYKDK